MDPKKRKYIIYTLFVLAVIYGLANLESKGPKTDTSSQPVPAPANRVPMRPSPNQIDIAKYNSLPWGKDPFVHETSTAGSAEVPSGAVWELGGILYDDTNPAAIINSRIVRVGQSIEGARVLRINKKMVTLEKDGREFSITLEKEKS
jgi:type II secretory pathway component PulC